MMETFSRIWLATMLACMVFTLARSFTAREQASSCERQNPNLSGFPSCKMYPNGYYQYQYSGEYTPAGAICEATCTDSCEFVKCEVFTFCEY